MSLRGKVSFQTRPERLDQTAAGEKVLCLWVGRASPEGLPNTVRFSNEGKNGSQCGKSAEEKADPQVQTQAVEERTTATAGTGAAPSVIGDASMDANGKPVATLEQMIQMASQVLQVPGVAGATPTSLKVLRVTGIAKTCWGCEGERPMALLDSGATHALRMAESEQEWLSSEFVKVALAGKQSVNVIRHQLPP